MTDGQLDPKTGGGGERPDKIQPITVKRPKDREVNPFHFPRPVRTMLFAAYTGQNLFQDNI